MTTLLAIDPGAKTGFASFSTHAGKWRLTHAQVAKPVENDGYVRLGWDIVVIERPRIYPNQKARPDDIITLAMTAGRYVERFCGAEIRLVTPREWKGTIDGDIMTRRILDALTYDERDIAQKYGFDHNILDAIGLGKWALRQPWVRVRGS